MKILKKIMQFACAEEGSLGKKFIRATVLSSFAYGMKGFIGLFRSIILARILYPEDFGILASAAIFVKLVDTLTQTGLTTALMQRTENTDEAFSTVFCINILRGLTLATTLYFSAGIISNFYGNSQIENIIKILSLSMIAKSFRNINIIKKQKELDYKKIAKLTLYTEFILFPLTILLTISIKNAYALAFTFVLGHTIDAILSHILIESQFSFKFDRRIATTLFKFGKFVSGAGVLVYVTTELDNFVVGKLLGMNTLGIYLIAYTMANLPCTHLVNTLSGVITPAYCKVQNAPGKLPVIFTKVLKTLLIIILPASFGIFLLSNELIDVLYGPKWHDAAELINILVVFGALRAIASTTGPIFISIGKPHIPFYLVSAKLIAMTIMIVPATYFFGIHGTCWTVCLCMLAEQAVLWNIVSKSLSIKMDELARILYRPLTSSLIMTGFIVLFKQNIQITNVFTFFGVIISAAALYSLSYFTLFNKDYLELKQSFSA